MVYNDIKHVLPEFSFAGRYLSAEELHSGNINNTYHLVYLDRGRERHYTLQHINSYVFKAPDRVMRNIERVTGHLRERLEAEGMDPKRHVLELVALRSGGTLFQDSEGGFWRAYHFIENATAYDRVRAPRQFFEAGRGFGMFQRRLFDFPAGSFSKPFQLSQHHAALLCLCPSVADDRAGRVAELEDEIEFFFERRRMMGQIVKKLADGALPVRVTHNDTKVNNVMIDDRTGEAICVIDLDTVMPGSSLYDYGDAIRFGASTAAEDEPDTNRISLNMEMFELFTRGFFQETKGFLTREELTLMPLGARVMTCELAMRFLTDYIDGDLYFKVNAPEHNLIRARAQMKLLTDIEAKYDQMMEFASRLAAD
jgi:Ser/Thr protein kinase RdoA (MazF antagonist)